MNNLCISLVLVLQLSYYHLLGHGNNDSHTSVLIIETVEQLQSSQYKQWRNNRSYHVFHQKKINKETRFGRIHSTPWYKKQTRKAKLVEIPNICIAVMKINFIQLLLSSVQMLWGLKKNHVNLKNTFKMIKDSKMEGQGKLLCSSEQENSKPHHCFIYMFYQRIYSCCC